MASYFQVKVQFTVEDSKGKVKKQNVLYLVDSQSVTEAEARVVKYLTDNGEQEFEVKAASESPIASVVTAEQLKMQGGEIAYATVDIPASPAGAEYEIDKQYGWTTKPAILLLVESLRGGSNPSPTA